MAKIEIDKKEVAGFMIKGLKDGFLYSVLPIVYICRPFWRFLKNLLLKPLHGGD